MTIADLEGAPLMHSRLTTLLPACRIATFVLTMVAFAGGCDQADSAATTPNKTDAGSPSNSNRGTPLAGTTSNVDSSIGAESPRADAAYATVLSQVVNEEGLVRYTLLASEELRKQLDAAIAEMAAATLPAESDDDGRKALWINAFNANAMKFALDEKSKEGFKTVNDVPGFFDQRTLTAAGESTTLNALRERLRALKDPRIHSALVCAAKGSPPLRNEPFNAAEIDQQLDNQSLVWLDDQAENRAARDGLWLSSVFEQFASDFDGQPYEGMIGFARKHSRPNGGIRDFLRSVTNIRVKHREFDWTLNDEGAF